MNLWLCAQLRAALSQKRVGSGDPKGLEVGDPFRRENRKAGHFRKVAR